MYLETIAIEHGTIRHASYHQRRMKQTAGVEIDLNTTFHSAYPNISDTLYYKWRIEYSTQGIISSSITPYSIRPVTHLVTKEISENLDYHLKYADRSTLDNYAHGLPTGHIPLLLRGDWVTDTTYTNVCFYDQDSKWVTPSTPLLKGVMRQTLLDAGEIIESDVRIERLREFRFIALINAMIPLGKLVLPMECLIF